MIRFVADENFNGLIVRGVQRIRPEIDIVRVQDAGLRGIDDPDLLDWAAVHQRVLSTHDSSTMAGYAYERVRLGLAMPGALICAPEVDYADVIDSIVLVALCSDPTELTDQVRYLPL